MRKLKGALVTWVSSLDPDVVHEVARSRYERGHVGFQALPNFTWSDNGWHLSFHAYPLSEEARGIARSAVGIWGSGEAEIVDNVTGILRKLNDKQGRYGQLDAPLVIAVLSNTEIPTRDWEVEQALYGISSLRPAKSAVSPSSTMIDGFWITSRGLRRAHVPQVISITNLSPWMVTKISPRLWTTFDEVEAPTQPSWLARADTTGPEAHVEETTEPADHFGLPRDLFSGEPDFT
jgi:hypothetical protein